MEAFPLNLSSAVFYLSLLHAQLVFALAVLKLFEFFDALSP